MRDGNACLGLFTGCAIAIPIYLGIAWVVSRVTHIAYGLALVGCLVVGSITGGLIFWHEMRREKSV